MCGTMGFTIEQHGAYIFCIILQFNTGHFTEAQAIGVVGKTWDSIKHKFSTDKNGLFFNKRLEEEKEKRIKYTESRSKNRKHMNHICKTYVQHMEDEDEDEDRDINDSKNSLKKGDHKGESSWRTDYDLYLKESEAAFDAFAVKKEWMDQRQEFYPNLDIYQTMKKAYIEFWGTKAGWAHKKKSRAKDPDWERTILNAISLKTNQVYKPKTKDGAYER